MSERSLVPPGALDLRPTGQALLRALAGRPTRPASVRERERAENRQTMHRLRRWGTELGAEFHLGDYHEILLAHVSPPMKFLRRLLTP